MQIHHLREFILILRDFFSWVEKFSASREFFSPVENFFRRSRIFLSVENFFTGRELFGRSRIVFVGRDFFTRQKVFGRSGVFLSGRDFFWSVERLEGPTERLSSFVDKLLQPIAQTQKSYLKDTTHFINFIEKAKVSQDTILVSMDVTNLHTNIPQEEGITTVCKTYEKYHNYNPPIPSHYLKEMLCPNSRPAQKILDR